MTRVQLFTPYLIRNECMSTESPKIIVFKHYSHKTALQADKLDLKAMHYFTLKMHMS